MKFPTTIAIALAWLPPIVSFSAPSQITSKGSAVKDVSSSDRLRVVVVGGGVGGLATAARIASSTNADVTVLEKNQHVGGRSGSFGVSIPNVGTFRHERGASLLLLPHIYNQLFEDCSARPEDFGLDIRPCVPAYQVVFDDGDRLDVGFPESSCAADASVQEQYMESRRKMDRLEPNGASNWDDYQRACSAFLDCGLPNFIEERLDILSFPAFLIEALRDFGKRWPLKPHSDVLDDSFESEKMKALASFQDLYVGLEPYRNNNQLFGGVAQTTAPAVFGLLAAIELHPSNNMAGVFAAVGGFRAVSESFAALAEARGVTIETGKMVTKIQNDGVHVQPSKEDDETNFVPADLVIVNADLSYASKSLLESSRKKVDPQQPRFDWDDKFLFSSGVVAFHWSIGKELKDLNTHNVFLAAAEGRSQAEDSWRLLRPTKSSPQGDSKMEPFNFYVHCPTKTDPTAAPKDCDSIMVLVPCATLDRNPDYASLPREQAIEKYKEQFNEDVISKMREAVLARFAAIDSLVDLKDHILDEVVDTPATFADQFHVGAGTPFALSHGFGQLSLTRPGPKYQLESPNILYCGASSRPGNGVPLVLIGSKLVADKALSIVREMQEASQSNPN